MAGAAATIGPRVIGNMITPGQARIIDWRHNPLKFINEVLHATPDAWQEDVVRAYADPNKQRIAQLACAGPGKTAVLAWLAWHFLLTRADRGHHPNGAAVSITNENLRDNLWKELAVWRGRSKLLQREFEWTASRVFARQYPETWWLSARSFSKTSDADKQGRTLSGLHSRYILYLIDESGDINPAVLRSAEQGLSNCKWGKIIQAGNPTSLSGMLHHAAKTQSHMWEVIRITGDPDDPKRSPRIDIAWARQQIAEYGRDNPWVMAYILGMFPPSSINALLGPDEVEAAMRRGLHVDMYNFIQKRLGIDVAREGNDRTVIAPRQGLFAGKMVVMRTQLGRDIAARVAQGKIKWGSEMEFFDDTGGWAGAAIEAYNLSGNTAYPVNFSGKAIDPRYLNKRAEMHFSLANWVRAGGSLPRDPDLVRELCAPTYTFHNGKFQLEEKAQIKKRLLFSPDKADALALTFALPDMPTSAQIPGVPIQTDKIKSDWNPFAPERM